jgi:hypothetical protein
MMIFKKITILKEGGGHTYVVEGQTRCGGIKAHSERPWVGLGWAVIRLGEFSPSYILHTRAIGTYLLGGYLPCKKIIR